MRVLSLSTLKAFYEEPRHADAKGPLLAWYRHVLKSQWDTPSSIKADFRTVSILKNGRVVFNIAGNKYRLITAINYSYGIMYIRFIGTHQQYDVIDAQNV
jgi:mRNA interferase HigB